MRVDAVVDVGNTSIKCARCTDDGFWPTTRLSHRRDEWEELAFFDHSVHNLALGGVVPAVVNNFAAWAVTRGFAPTVIRSASQIPISVHVPNPSSVGTDRLFDALAGARRFPNCSLLIVDAGTAITLNVVSRSGAFEGGAILAGLALMAKSLNDYTALLPNVRIDGTPDFPGKDTESNINSGIMAAAIGAVEHSLARHPPDVLVFTGSDAELLYRHVSFAAKQLIPTLTLEGIRIAAEALP